jgi:carboxylate-amine ligase
VELRAPDVQTDASYTAALAALVQCLVARVGMDGQPPDDALYNAENKWRAVRYGMDAAFYDFAAGRMIPARSMARGLVEELRPVARDLGCEEELGSVLEIVELGTGAELQRAALRRSGSLVGMMDYLTKGTAPG